MLLTFKMSSNKTCLHRKRDSPNYSTRRPSDVPRNTSLRQTCKPEPQAVEVRYRAAPSESDKTKRSTPTDIKVEQGQAK